MKNKSKFSIVKILLVLTIAFLGVFFTIREIEGKKIKTVNTPVSKQKVETIEEDINNLSNRIDDLDLIISNQENVSFSSATLLWENESQTSSFGAQTIQLDDNDCDFFMIKCGTNCNNLDYTIFYFCKVSEGSLMSFSCSSGTPSGYRISVARMILSSTQTSLTFSDAGASSGTGDSQVTNFWMIPLEVYGLYI